MIFKISQVVPNKWPWLVLFSVLALSAAVSYRTHLYNEERIKKEVVHSLELTVAEIFARINLYHFGLRGARGAILVAGEQQLTRQLFITYSNSRNVDVEFPGARGIGFIRRVPVAEQARFLTKARADDWPNFQIQEITPNAAERYIIQYIEPVSRNLAAVGLDIASENNRRNAANAAIRTGEAQLTGPITLVQASGQPQQSFLFLLPIYRGGVTPEQHSDREQQAFGWSYAPLLMTEVLADFNVNGNIQLLQLTDVTEQQDAQLFFANFTSQQIKLYPTTQQHWVYGRLWQFDYAVTPNFITNLNLLSPLQLFFYGSVVAFLLALLTVYMQINRVNKRRLYAEQAKLAAIVESSVDGIIGNTLSGQISSWNRGAEMLLGFDRREMLGTHSLDKIFSPTVLAAEPDYIQRLTKGENLPNIETVLRRKDGSEVDVSLSISPIYSFNGRLVGTSKTMRDISQQKQHAAQISKLAFYDPLTGCGNRRLLEKDVTVQLQTEDRQPFVLFFIDLDHFKNVNDVHGHAIGDLLLTAVIGRFKNAVREADTIYRVGGDEFIILFKNLPAAGVLEKAEQLIAAASLPFFIKQIELHISASIGISHYPVDGKDFETLLKHADTALYQAKAEGRHCYRLFSDKMMSQVLKKITLDQSLRRALDKQELSIAVMPQVNCKTLKSQRAEVLLRWHNQDLGNVPPEEFIPIAEYSEVIHALTKFVVIQTLMLIRAINVKTNKVFNLAVNLSSKDLKNSDFFASLLAILTQHKDITSQLTIEVTESIFIDDYDLIVAHLEQLKQLNISISIDDFGTGYSCLSYLRQLPINELKIDRSFMTQVNDDNKVCLAIIGLAKSLGYLCIAEGVETAEQLQWLQHVNCDFSQGFYHAKPLTLDVFLDEFLLANI